LLKSSQSQNSYEKTCKIIGQASVTSYHEHSTYQLASADSAVCRKTKRNKKKKMYISQLKMLQKERLRPSS